MNEKAAYLALYGYTLGHIAEDASAWRIYAPGNLAYGCLAHVREPFRRAAERAWVLYKFPLWAGCYTVAPSWDDADLSSLTWELIRSLTSQSEGTARV